MSPLAFLRAVKLYGLPRNPLANIDRYRVRRSGHIEVFSPEEIWSLVRAAASEIDGTIFLTAAFTGLRRGELVVLVASSPVGSGRTNFVKVETVGEVYNQDQSTLAALNLSGLGAIVTVFAALMSAAAAAIFVATTFAARRKEYVTLQALGVDPASVRRLLIVEGALLVGVALIVGLLVGAATATLNIQILAPLFVIAPVLPDLALGGVGTMGALVVAAAATAIAVGSGRISNLRAAELLREE